MCESGFGIDDAAARSGEKGMTPKAGPDRSRGVFLSRVVRNEPLCREHWRLVLEAENFPPAAPGQFVQILCTEPGELGWTQGAFIRRPFSIAGLQRDGGRSEIEILHRAVGTGTRWLSRLRRGEPVSLLGPLGRPFEIPAGRHVAWLVGGGIGLPPLIWLARELHAIGRRAVAFCGARTADFMPLTRVREVPVSFDEGSLSYEEFAAAGVPVVACTDDGSLGAAARVPVMFAQYLKRHSQEAAAAEIYACGPEPMLRAVAKLGMEHGIPTQVCMERVMACGMGTCQSCVVRIHDASAEGGWRYRLCCTDGPVFDARAIVWDG
jgi:dihydroorotate dehydrogenase electron transfer subunit